MESKTTDELYYEKIANEYGIDYHFIGGLKLYMSFGSEGYKREYAQKIVDYARLLQSEKFIVHHAEYEKPKIFDGKLSYIIGSEI